MIICVCRVAPICCGAFVPIRLANFAASSSISFMIGSFANIPTTDFQASGPGSGAGRKCRQTRNLLLHGRNPPFESLLRQTWYPPRFQPPAIIAIGLFGKHAGSPKALETAQVSVGMW